MKLRHSLQSNEKPFYNRSLERALRILNAFSNTRPMLSLAQLSDAVNLPRATVLRLAATLLEFGFLRQDPVTKQYSLGFRLLELGNSVSDSFSLTKIANPYMAGLQSKIGKTIFLGVLDNDEVLYIGKRDDLCNPIAFTSSVGTRRPPVWGMMGSILMAYLSESEKRRLLKKSPLVAFTKNSITKEKDFLQWLHKVREQGYVIDREMGFDGITGVAAPIFDHNGKAIAGLGVGFISSSVSDKELERIVEEVTRTALMISKELGYNQEGSTYRSSAEGP